MDQEIRDCDFCGSEEVSNRILQGEPIIEFLDGPLGVSVPNTVLCDDCTQDVSDYLRARTAETNQDLAGLSPFEEADAQAVLDRLVENEHLVMELGQESGYGIRFVDNEWKRAVSRIPSPPTVVTLNQEEVRDLILRAKRLTLKQFDSSAWEGFERW